MDASSGRWTRDGSVWRSWPGATADRPDSRTPGTGPHRARDSSPMKRTFAVVGLLAALGVLFKLALKEGPGPGAGRTARDATLPGPDSPDPEAELRARYTDPRD